MSILVFVDQANDARGAVRPVSWEIMGRARSLADATGLPLVALVAGDGVGAVAHEAFGYGADRVLVADAPEFADFRAHTWSACLKSAIAEAAPRIILAPAVAGIRDAAALAACELGIGLAADCQGLALDDAGNLLAERAVFAGNIIATVTFAGQPQMATVRPRSFPMPAKDADRAGEPTPLAVQLGGPALVEEILGFEPTQASAVAVDNAAIIVAGGRGVKGPEGFAPIRELAQVLGAAVGASRAAVDAGWIPYPHQVGQTGKTVRPDLYLAFGISGAIQHLAGMNNARVIVAINKDPNAPIFKIARYGIVGDLFEVAPALTQVLRSRLAK